MNSMSYGNDIISQTYSEISSTANSNAAIEAAGSIFGMGINLVLDVATIGTHYIPMVNKIRRLYGKAPWSLEEFATLLKAIKGEILFDFVFDKALGTIPLVGTYFNYICAKSMIFRVGMLCAMCSCLKNDVTDIETFTKTSALIREVFPQKSVFKFATPDYNTFKKLMLSVMNNTVVDYETKLKRAMAAFDACGETER